MNIIWHGQSCFQISANQDKNNQVLTVIDPVSGGTNIKKPSLQADILIVTRHYNNSDIASIGGNPFLVDSPGEYEIKKVFINGIPSFSIGKENEKKRSITIYAIEAEGINICHLGDLRQEELTVEQLERIGSVDILMIAIGGENAVNGGKAGKIIKQIQPRIVIPMCYQSSKSDVKSGDLDEFLNVVGRKAADPQKKLSIKKKDLPEEKMQIMILQS